MHRSISRWLPAAAVVLLLALALLAPTRRVSAEKSTPQTDYLYYTICTPIASGGSGAQGIYNVPVYEGVTQPLGTVANVATCSLTVQAMANSATQFNVVFWDPNTLAPAAGTVALRSRNYPLTGYSNNVSRQDFTPPVITKVFTNAADPPPAQLAMELRVTSGSNSQAAQLVQNDNTAAAPALRILQNGTRIPIPGTHPVFVHTVCGGDAALQAMQVMQCVSRSDVALDPLPFEYIQKFRLPMTTSLGWVELAFASYYPPGGNIVYGRVRIVDAAGQSAPPVNFGTPLADANFYHYSYPGWNPDAWDANYDFPSLPVLQGGHDYWLVVTTNSDYSLIARQNNGTESPWFTQNIRGLWRRNAAGENALMLDQRALDFRIIGTPVGSVGVSPIAPSRSAFALEVSPNPALGATSIAWAGAQGGVRFEVLDARGRRVASGVNATGGNGRWSFTGAGDDGRALPAGIYFVHALDESGHSATARVSLIR